MHCLTAAIGVTCLGLEQGNRVMKKCKVRNFRFEALEGRICLAAAASVDLSGNLLITHDMAADFDITQIAATEWTVTDAGVPVGPGTFTGVTGNVTVRTSAADDVIQVTMTGQTAPRCVIVESGAGNDEVLITGGTVALTLDIRTGSGDDEITVEGVTVNGVKYINTGHGANTVSVSDGSAGTLIIATGADDDTVTIGDGVTAYSVTGIARVYDNGGPNDLLTVADNVTLCHLITNHVNTVSLAPTSALTGSLYFTSGYNVLNQLNLAGAIDGSVHMYGSGGSDTLTTTATSVVGGSVNAYLSYGDDNINLAGTIVNSLYLDAGAGDDTISIDGLVGNRVSALLGLGNDFFELLGNIGVAPGTTSRLGLDAGSGNDQVALRDGSEVNGSASINMGAGDDELSLGDTAFIISALFNGGTGLNDKYYGNLPRTGVTQVSFEVFLANPPPF
jgi:hypothetical protein